MSTTGTDSEKCPAAKSHLYLAALVLSGSLLPVPIVATIFTAAFFIAPFPIFSLPLLSPWKQWLVIVAGFAIALIIWLLSALFFRQFTSVESANPVSQNHLRSHLSTLQAGFDALNRPNPNSQSLPRGEYDYCYQIAYAQVDASLEQIKELLKCRDKRWIVGTGYLYAWRLVHRAEEAMIMLEPHAEVIREAIYDEMALTGSSIAARASALKKLKRAVENISVSATQYLDYTDTADKQTVVSNSKGHKSTTVSETSLVEVKTPPSPTVGERVTTTDEKNLTTGETPIVTAQGSSVASVSAPSMPTVQPPHAVTMSGRPVAHDSTAEIEARNVLREVRRVIDEYRDHLWERVVIGRNLLMGTALIVGLLTYVLLCFAIVADATAESIKAAIVFYLVGAVVGLFSRLYDESRVSNPVNDYKLSLVRIIVTPVLSGISGVMGVLLTDLLSLTLSKSALPLNSQAPPQFGLADSFNIQQNTLGILIAAAFALTPNLLINSLRKKANDFADQMQSTGASDQVQSSDHPPSSSNKL